MSFCLLVDGELGHGRDVVVAPELRQSINILFRILFLIHKMHLSKVLEMQHNGLKRREKHFISFKFKFAHFFLITLLLDKLRLR